MLDLSAVTICRHVRQSFPDGRAIEGQVHSVFRRACNLDFKNRPLVVLLEEDLPVKPMAIIIRTSGAPTLSDLGLQNGQEVRWDRTCMHFPAAGITLELQRASVADCSPKFDFVPVGIAQFRLNLAILRDVLQEGNPLGLLPVVSSYEASYRDPGEILPSNRYSEIASPVLKELLNAINWLDFKKISASSEWIAGFGPGLTPSGDDLLAGIMLGLIYSTRHCRLSMETVDAINASILSSVEGKTTRLSYEMMVFAGQGEAAEDIHLLLKTLHSGTGKNLAEIARSVLRLGETSGADLLAGIYLAGKQLFV